MEADAHMTITIEDASVRHLDRLYEIEIECFSQEAFTKQQIAHLLTDYNSLAFIARNDSEIVGFIIGTVYVGRNFLTGHILTVDVLPSHRRTGIGQKLLEQTESMFRDKGIRECRLEVREDNVAALSLYRKLGYKEVAKLKNYYGNANGIYLRKALG